MKKLLSLFLALVMLFSLVACGVKEEPAPAPETDPVEKAPEKATEADDSWKEEHPTWLCEEKTTLTVYTYDAVSSAYLPPSNDLYFWQFLEDYTNVHVEWEVVPYADYGTLVSAKLASGGTLPDIINVNEATVSTQAGGNELLVDLSPLWDTHFTNTQTYFDEMGFAYKDKLTNEDGTMYSIATVTSPVSYNQMLLMFNKLWMEKLGLKEPTSLEELNEVLRAMKAAGDLNGNGQDDEIILTSAKTKHLMTALHNIFGIEATYGQPQFAAGEDGVVYDQYTDDNAKGMLTWLSQMYKEGILDSEITISTADLLTQKIAADRVGVIAYYSSFVQSYSKLTSAGQADPAGQYYIFAQPLTSEFVEEGYSLNSPTYGSFTGISKDCQNVELAAQWLDTLFADPVIMDLRDKGPEGICWEDVDGVPTPIFNEDGTQVDNKQYGCGQLTLPWIHPATSWSYASSRPWFDPDYQPYYDAPWIERSVPIMPSTTEYEQELQDTYWADLEAGWEEYRDKFITGDLDVEADWEEYVGVLEALGLKEMIECYQSVYDRSTAGK